MMTFCDTQYEKKTLIYDEKICKLKFYVLKYIHNNNTFIYFRL